MTSNRTAMASYLGRVNLLALVPTLLVVAGIALAAPSLGPSLRRGGSRRTRCRALLFTLVTTSLLGYMWFLIAYPNLGKGDTIKATYVLHALPLAAILGADLLIRLRDLCPALYHLLLVVLLASAVHNFPTLCLSAVWT